MEDFSCFAPTRIVFGCGKIAEIGLLAKRYGRRALLVTTSVSQARAPLYDRIKNLLAREGMECGHFAGVIPNPTTDIVTLGAEAAREMRADLVLGVGGGSAMDAAKAIAVEATHPGTAWDYLHYKPGPTEKTLPIIAVGTTAGTGSQTTPCSVITKTEAKDKSAIWHENIFPRLALVDPELTVTMPPDVTAQTGFDAFCHNFEAFISRNSNPMAECLAKDAIARIAGNLQQAFLYGRDIEARSEMAWADTLGGLTNSSAGVTLPHGLGMQVGGHCPHVTHGQALAAIYPEFLRYTLPSCVGKFAEIARIFDPKLRSAPDLAAAEALGGEMENFLKGINLWIGFKDLGVSRKQLREIAACGQVLGDYKNNPRVASLEEMDEILQACYER